LDFSGVDLGRDKCIEVFHYKIITTGSIWSTIQIRFRRSFVSGAFIATL